MIYSSRNVLMHIIRTFIVLAGLQNQCYRVTGCLLMHVALPSYRNGVLQLNRLIVSPKNDFVTTISTAVHRKQYIQFCVESAKCAIFADLFYKDICEINNTFLQYILIKRKVKCSALKALKWQLSYEKMN